MLSDITSDQHDSTQCRHCGVTLAARLPSCPSCGANQLDPLGWYPPAAGSANARLAPPSVSNVPQLAAPAAWHTPAGAEDDRFYAKHDPWRAPRSYRWVWIVVLLAVALLPLALAGYFVLRPGTEVSVVAPKAVFGAVTAQQAAPLVAPPAPSRAPSVAAVNLARPAHVPTSASLVVAAQPPVATQPVAKLSAPAISMPKATVPKTLAVQGARAPAPGPQGAMAQSSPAQAQAGATARSPASTPAALAKPAAPPVALFPRPDALANLQKNLQGVRVMLQKNNLSAADARLAAVLAVQPKNRDALAMRADLQDREQQRDVALDVARGCENIGRWTCAWHNAGNALVLDSSSADAKRIIARAMSEDQSSKAPGPAPQAEPVPSGPYHH
jgi:hypothetical protein